MITKTLTRLLAPLLLLVPALTQATASEAEGISVRDTFAPFQTLLDRHLIEREPEDGGLVSAFAYRSALQDEKTRGLLDEQSQRLARFDPEQLQTREAANAFWINAYNFFMVKQILANPVDGELIDSVKDYGSWLNPYRVFQQERFTIGAEQYSLDGIEKETLLGDRFAQRGWKDARVHFAVNCASVGCPPLRAEVYDAETLDARLDENVRRALSTSYHLRRDGDTLYLSQLFEWYESDYLAEADSIRDWLLRFAAPEVAQQIRATDGIRYIDYDWTLNRPDNFPELAGR